MIIISAVTQGAEQLTMYMDGMGGTGKSQVIKTLISSLNPEMNPTDLLSWHLQNCSSTFKWFNLSLILGVSTEGQEALRNETTNNAQVKTRLDGVDYIFLDEFSMVHAMIIIRSALNLQKQQMSLICHMVEST